MNPETATIVDWPLIRSLAAASHRAYASATVTDPFTDAQALIEVQGDAIVVAFRGSSTPRDFIQDSEVWMTELTWQVSDMAAEVHHGFLEDFNAIAPEVLKQVRMHKDTNRAAHIYITGHSLGGALAILCALEFARENLPVAGVITFGQPRVGNAAFAMIYDGTLHPNPIGAGATLRDITFRVVNENDIVPRTPGVLLHYRHCGQEIFLEPGAGWELNPAMSYKLLCDAFGLWTAFSKKEASLITNHFIAAYEQRIQLL